MFIIANVLGFTGRAIVGLFSCINILHSNKVIFDFYGNGYMKI